MEIKGINVPHVDVEKRHGYFIFSFFYCPKCKNKILVNENFEITIIKEPDILLQNR